MAIKSNISAVTVSVGTSAIQICAGRTSRNNLIVQNAHASQNLFVGDSTVDVTTGLRVAAGASVGLENFNGPLYGIASGAATDTRVVEIY